MENRSDVTDRIKALSTGTKIIVPAALLLLIDTFRRWQEVCADLGPLGETCGGVSAWDDFWGIVLGLLTLVLLVWIGLQIAQVDLSGVNLPVTDAMITLGLGVLIFVFALLKNLIDDYSTIWSYIGVVLAAVVAYGSYVRSRELEDVPPRDSLGGSDTRPGDAPAGTREDDVGRAMDAGSAEATGTTLAGGATTSTSGSTATTRDVERDDVEPPSPSTTMPPGGEMPPSTLEPPAPGRPDDRPPPATSGDR